QQCVYVTENSRVKCLSTSWKASKCHEFVSKSFEVAEKSCILKSHHRCVAD
ncbi:unnamed protein product, partial [Ceratitis capitata]